MTTDLSTWLLQQIEEDEHAVRDLEKPWDAELPMSRRPIHESIQEAPDIGGAARFRLAECDAKRRIVNLHADEGQSQGYTEGGYGYHEHACGTCGSHGEYGVPWPCPTLRLLALPYADRPGYREEWR